jgi:hypothetical protein
MIFFTANQKLPQKWMQNNLSRRTFYKNIIYVILLLINVNGLLLHYLEKVNK